MIPTNSVIDFETQEENLLTYKLYKEEKRLAGTVNDVDAIEQAIYLLLNIERYAYPIYPPYYGVELQDLIGQHPEYVMSEAKRRITEAIMILPEVKSVDDFEFERVKNTINCFFTVHTILGDVQMSKGVEI